MPQTLVLLPVRLRFRCLETVVFPPGQPGNTLRGAFGSILRRLVCEEPQCRPSGCARRTACPYVEIFEPLKPPGWPSGFATPPRGFVFRVHHLDGTTLSPGDAFHVDLHLFHRGTCTLFFVTESLSRLSEEGLGPGRGRATLEGVELLGGDGRVVRAVDGPEEYGRLEPLTLPLSPQGEPARHAGVQFLTPTELKAGGAPVPVPEFAVLMARIRDRVSALRALYGAGPLAMDFDAFARRAAAVRLVRHDLHWVKATRRSTRTGQRHPIGGFTGHAEYAGDLDEFLPFLRAAAWTGVGRQTVWGKGAIKLTIAPD